jgi:ribosomal protein L31E
MDLDDRPKNISVVVGYIMYYDLLKEKYRGSFFTKIDKAIELATEFVDKHQEHEDAGWVDIDFEETLENFINEKTKIPKTNT